MGPLLPASPCTVLLLSESPTACEALNDALVKEVVSREGVFVPDAAWLDCVEVGATDAVRPFAACAYENGAAAEACSPVGLLAVDAILLNVAMMLVERSSGYISLGECDITKSLYPRVREIFQSLSAMNVRRGRPTSPHCGLFLSRACKEVEKPKRVCRIVEKDQRKSLTSALSVCLDNCCFAQNEFVYLGLLAECFLDACRKMYLLVVDEKTDNLLCLKIDSRTYVWTRRTSDEEFASRGAKFSQTPRTNTLNLESHSIIS